MKSVSEFGVRLKAQLLCEGMTVDVACEDLFRAQNPQGVKRGGLSSGGKIQLDCGLFVNVPIYRQRKTELRAVHKKDNTIAIKSGWLRYATAQILPAPAWYDQTVQGFPITQILTAHNKQLAGSVYEDCALFSRGTQCRFCVINHSLTDRDPRLVRKSPHLILDALERIPTEEYGGLTLNGGMTTHPGRGMEIMVPVVAAIRRHFPSLPIAIEITPPADLNWIDRLAEAGASSLMMNLECWDPQIRKTVMPGKDALCPREQYLAAFDRGVSVFGRGRISSCFVVGTEPMDSLKKGIDTTIEHGAIPSPLAGRTFEDIPDYPFTSLARWQELFDILMYTKSQLKQHRLQSCDQAGCVACKMCDLVGDVSGRVLFDAGHYFV